MQLGNGGVGQLLRGKGWREEWCRPRAGKKTWIGRVFRGGWKLGG